MGHSLGPVLPIGVPDTKVFPCYHRLKSDMSIAEALFWAPSTPRSIICPWPNPQKQHVALGPPDLGSREQRDRAHILSCRTQTEPHMVSGARRT